MLHNTYLAAGGGTLGQLSFAWVPPPTATEVARGVADQLKAKAQRAGGRVAALTRRRKCKLRQADWLDPADYANEMIAQHRGEFARDDMRDLQGTFYLEFVDRMTQMLRACALKIKRWVGVTWRKVYYKLVAAKKKYGDEEKVAVKRGHERVTCTSLTSADGEEIDPSAVGATALADDPDAPADAEDTNDEDSAEADEWLKRHDPTWANSTRTAERRRREAREEAAAIARSAARCQQLAGRCVAGDEP